MCAANIRKKDEPIGFKLKNKCYLCDRKTQRNQKKDVNEN